MRVVVQVMHSLSLSSAANIVIKFAPVGSASPGASENNLAAVYARWGEEGSTTGAVVSLTKWRLEAPI